MTESAEKRSRNGLAKANLFSCRSKTASVTQK